MTTNAVYGNYPLKAIVGAVNFTTNTVKCALISNAYTPNVDTDIFFGAPATYQGSGTGYTAGGVTLTTKTATYNASTNTAMLDADDITFTGVTLSAVRYAVFYEYSGSNATSPLICYMDFGADRNPTAQNLQITLPSTGLVYLTV